MRRFICALVVFSTLAAIKPAEASSIVFDFSGLVSSDVYTSPVPGPPYSGYYPSTIPANAVGQPFSGVASFSDVNAVAITSNTFTGLLQAGQTALATLIFQGTSGPFSLSSNLFPNSNPQDANLAFNSNGFTSSTQFPGAPGINCKSEKQRRCWTRPRSYQQTMNNTGT
jgi:hypothetical protein